MVFEFKFPDVGEGIHEGKLVKWHVQEGDNVNHDQILCEVETDKAVVEIPSPKTSKILKLHGKEGEIIHVGDTLVTFEADDEPSENKNKVVDSKLGEAKSSSQTTDSSSAANKAGSVVGFLEEGKDDNVFTRNLNKDEKKADIHKNIIATLAVKKLAKDIGVDLTKVIGTGSGGRITEDDVKQFSNESKTSIKTLSNKVSSTKNLDVKNTDFKNYDLYGSVEHLPLTSIRKSIAHKMQESVYTAPHVTVIDEVDITNLHLKKESDKILAESKNIKITYLTYIAKAVTNALKLHPLLNSTLNEKDEEIIIKKYYNLGIAVDTTEGLMVPVVKKTDELNIFEIANEVTKLSEAARDHTIGLSNLKGSTFSITNIGSMAGLYFTPIINFPEVAILGIGRIQDRAKFQDNKFEQRKILPLSLSFDHRVVDGAEAARFLKDVMIMLENPEKII